ncbi:MAG: hypothetical protein Q8N99_08260 [Nanoarchaeota archaeon]|nr:hypothetical protein [Nanoarchaeota archaeon]
MLQYCIRKIVILIVFIFKQNTNMQDHILKTPGTFEEIEIRCPECNTKNVTVILLPKGYYKVIECHNCGRIDNPDPSGCHL